MNWKEELIFIFGMMTGGGAMYLYLLFVTRYLGQNLITEIKEQFAMAFRYEIQVSYLDNSSGVVEKTNSRENAIRAAHTWILKKRVKTVCVSDAFTGEPVAIMTPHLVK